MQAACSNKESYSILYHFTNMEEDNVIKEDDKHDVLYIVVSCGLQLRLQWLLIETN